MNVHINHPPEATVQIHQVARVRGDSEVSEENSVEAVLVPQMAAVPWYTYSNGNGNSIATEGGQQQRPPGLLGRCFREALHGQVRGHSSTLEVRMDMFLFLVCGCVCTWGRNGRLPSHESVQRDVWTTSKYYRHGQQCVMWEECIVCVTWEENLLFWPKKEAMLSCPEQAVPWGSIAQT